MSHDPPDGADTSAEAERLFREVRALVARGDRVPPAVAAAAREALAWRTLDADLARLVFDSSADSPAHTKEPLAVRGPATNRLLVFDGPGISIDVAVVDTDGRRAVLGQLAPARAGRVAMRSRGALRTTRADHRGRFRFDDVEEGLAILHCTTADGLVVQTAWFRL